MDNSDLYKMKIVEFIRKGVFPDIIISWFHAKRDGYTVYRDGKRCKKCGLKTWRVLRSGQCINCRMIKEGYNPQILGGYKK
jgi:predicted Zn-ribbon and HTH transcriptional regulator